MFETFFLESPISIIIHDKDTGEVIDANPITYQTYGVSSLEELKEIIFLYNEFPYTFQEAFEMIKKTNGKTKSFEWKNKRKDGSVFWEKINLKIISINGIDRIVAICVDITETKELQNKLLEKDDIFRKVLSLIPDMLSIHDIDYNIIYSNWNGFANVEKDKQIIGSKCYKTYRNNNDICIDCLNKEVIQTKKPKRKIAELPEKRWVDVNVIPVLNNNEVDMVIEWVRDITDIKLNEQELLKSEKRFKALHNASFGGIVIHDKGIIIECNQGLSDITGYTYDELIGSNGLNLISPKSLELVQTNIKNEYEKPYRAIGIRKNGEEYPIRLEARNIPYENKKVRVTEFRDITEQIKIENDLKESKVLADIANQSKSEFLANMSHEIRTPINGIVGMLELIKTTNLTQEQLKYVDMGIGSSNRLTSLLSDILDLSRIEAGKQTIVESRFKLEEICSSISSIFSITAWNKNIKLSCRLSPYLPIYVLGDETRIKQILFNLVGNAIKYTNEGHVDITFELINKNENSVKILCIISDSGIGIPNEKLKYIFNPFYQVDGSLTRVYQGAGLGLSIVKRLSELLNISIFIDSEENDGTDIYLCFDLLIGEKQDTEHASISTNIALKNRTILLAEDDELNQTSISLLLEKHGYVVIAVGNGDNVLEVLRNQKIDCILMDIQMPHKTGIEATNCIRNDLEFDHIKDIPIIALTAYAMEGDKEKFLKAGMDDYAAKPILINDLKNKIEHLISQKKRII